MVHLGPAGPVDLRQVDAALIDYTDPSGSRSTAHVLTWDVPWESGTGTDDRTGSVVRLVWDGEEWKGVAV
jgi:hypothetical protein